MRKKYFKLTSTYSLVYVIILIAAIGSLFSYASKQQRNSFAVTGTLTGNIFQDLNNNKIKDPGEPGFANIDVQITDVNDVEQTVVTNSLGNWTAVVPAGETVVDIQDFDQDEVDAGVVFPTVLDSDFPQNGLTLTLGADPKTVTVTEGGSLNTGPVGYAVLGCVTGCVYIDENGNGIFDVGIESTVAGATVIIDPDDPLIEDFFEITDANGIWEACTVPGNISALVVTNTGTPNIDPDSDVTQGVNPSQTIIVAGQTIFFGDDNNGDGVGDAKVGFFPPEFGTSTGIVFNDINFNGIQDVGEPGIPGVSVSIEVISGPGNNNFVQTNDEGVWTVDLEPGTYTSDVVEVTVDIGCPNQVLRSIDSDALVDIVVDDEETFAGFDGFFCPVPEIDLQKFGDYVDTNGDGGVSVGDAIEYTFTVTNTGNRQLSNITIDDVLVPVSGGPIALLPGESDTTTFTATYFITAADIDAGEVCNIATVTGFTPETFEVQDTVEEVCTATENLCETNLVKTGVLVDDGDGEITTNDVIEYTFEVTNTGDQLITGVSITDGMLGLTNAFVSPSTLAPGETGILGPVTYNIQQSDLNAGEVINNAEANWECQSGQTAIPSTDQEIVVLELNPQLTLLKGGQFVDDGNGQLDPNDVINYTFTVTNTGNVTIENAFIVDPLLDPTNPIIGPFDLPVGAFIEFNATNTGGVTTYSITPDDINAGVVCNQATVSGESPTDEPVSDVSDSVNIADDTGADDDITCTPLPPVGELDIIKFGTYVDFNNNGFVDVGDRIVYSFRVENIGNFPVFNITIDDDDIGITNLFVANELEPGDFRDVEDENTLFYEISNEDIAAGVFCNLATVNGETSEGTPVTDSDVLCTPLSISPAISIVKTGIYVDTDPVGVLNAGDLIEYTFTITNTGNVSLNNVVLDDPLLPNSPFTLPDLAPGEQIILSGSNDANYVYAIIENDITNGFVTNTACVNADDPTGSPVTESCSTEIITLSNVASIELLKGVTYVDANNDGIINAGDELSYDFTVTNTGDLEVTNLSIDDADIGQTGIVVSPSTLGVDETGTATATYVLTQSDIDAGEFCNSAIAIGSSTQGTVTDVSDSTNPLDGPGNNDETCWFAAAISIVKSGVLVDANNNGVVDVDDVIQYTLTVINNGSEDLTSIQVEDPLLGGDIGSPFNLAVGEEFTLPIQIYGLEQSDIEEGEVCNIASVEGVSSPSNINVSDESNEVCIDLDDGFISSIVLVKSATVLLGDDNTLNAGDQIQYTFTVTNTGGTNISNIELDDATINFENISVAGSLAPGVSAEVSTDASTNYIIIQEDIDAGEFCNTAVAEGFDPDGISVTSEASICTPLELVTGIVLEKGSVLNDENGDGLSQPGETIDYTFTVTNTGDAPLADVIILDPLFEVTNDIIFGPFNLNPGVAETFTLSYTLQQSDIDVGEVVNSATAIGIYLNEDVQDVSDSTNDNDGDEDDDPTVTPLLIENGLALLKSGVYVDTDENEMVNVGDQINYQFTLTNTGNTTLFNIVIDDVDDINVSIEVGTLLPGEIFTSEEILYSLVQADLQAGEKVNSATATGFNTNGGSVEDVSDSTNPADDTGEDDDPTVVLLDVPDDVIFYNGITPNGDGINDVLIIENIENFPSNNLKIFNRWGVLVYEAEAYGSIEDGERIEFDGTSDGRITIAKNEKLPTGTYIYIFEYVDFLDRTRELTGFIYINAD
ncbi:hypothetical protein GCM10009117_11360 [Gangjinia marincola]|uniref:Uncharacterized protein n=1 Tax=Gangjinia marincola TaxID=578463 RepID=A0ABN1MFZ0_9FLAO